MKKYLFIILFTFTLSSCNAQKNEFTDKRDGKTYKTILIGNNVWMAENLNFDMDNQGSYHYPELMFNSEQKHIEEAIEFYKIDKKNIKTCQIFGGMVISIITTESHDIFYSNFS